LRAGSGGRGGAGGLRIHHIGRDGRGGGAHLQLFTRGALHAQVRALGLGLGIQAAELGVQLALLGARAPSCAKTWRDS
jgi:hypothetical protein